jgi:hypothetical protein
MNVRMHELAFACKSMSCMQGGAMLSVHIGERMALRACCPAFSDSMPFAA